MKAGLAWTLSENSDKYIKEFAGNIPYGSDQVEVILQIIKHLYGNPRSFLDLGCGNGFVAKIMLNEFANSKATLIDISSNMIEQAKMELADKECNYFQMSLEVPLTEYISEPFDCIVSRFAIHHLPNDRKKELYGEIHNLLTPGGIFVNIEHVQSSTLAISAKYQELLINHLSSKLNQDRAEFEANFTKRPNDNILERVELQTGWLEEIGFENVDCYFKWYELAVFGGSKTR